MGLALVCNIDQRGRKHRYRIGFAFLALGVVVYALGSRFYDGTVLQVVAGVHYLVVWLGIPIAAMIANGVTT